MKNFSKKTIRRDGTTSTAFTVPAGVKTLKVSFFEKFQVENGSYWPLKLIDENGRVWAWGTNNVASAAGQVGDGTITNRPSPVQLFGQTWRAPFIRTDGQMVNMGNNAFGQIGDGTVVPKSTPTLVSGGIRFKKIVRGSTCVGLGEDGQLYVWGQNNHGQVGDGTTNSVSTPTLVMPGTTFVDFWTDSGNQFEVDGVNQPNTIFAKDSNNQTWAWGRDAGNAGSHGTGLSGSSSTPTLVVGSLNFTKISMATLPGSGSFAVGLTDTGAVYCMGYNANGQLGDNTIVTKSTPTLVIGGILFQDIGAGLDHVIGLSRDGTVYCWGNNVSGQLGQGNIFPKSSPVAVIGLASGCRRIAVATSSNYAIDADRRIYSWGDQSALFPVLGTGDNAKKSSPTLVNPIGTYGIVEDIIEPLNSNWVSVITSFFTRYSWGANGGAQGNFGSNSVGGALNTAQQLIGPAPVAQPAITGNIWNKRPQTKTESFIVSVTPGQAITVAHQTGGFAIPELGLMSSQFCEQVDLEWHG